MSYLPKRHDLPAVLTGDTFPEFRVLGITVGGAAPSSALASVRVDFRTSPAATSAGLTLTSGGGGITIDDAAAWAFTLDKFTPIELEAGTWYYDAQCTSADGEVRTYIKGVMVVEQDVSRAS